jgi:hypothetical protein
LVSVHGERRHAHYGQAGTARFAKNYFVDTKGNANRIFVTNDRDR